MGSLDGPLVVTEFASAAPAFAQLRSGRIRYTAIEASQRYVCFGANTGSIYVYDRTDASGTLRYRQAITSSDSEVSALAILPSNDNLLAVGNLKGLLQVFELNVDAGKDRKYRVRAISALCIVLTRVFVVDIQVE